MDTKKPRKVEEIRRRRRRIRFVRRCLSLIFIFIFLSTGYWLISKQSARINQESETSQEDLNSNQKEKEFDLGQEQKEVKVSNNSKNSEDSAVEENETEQPVDQIDTTLLFTGDILLSDYVLGNYEAMGIDGILSKDLQVEMQQADVTMVNQEFPFSERGMQAQDKQYTFRVNPDKVEIFKNLGIDIVTLANNHSLDFGKDALTDSFATLDNAGIKYVGAGDSLERAKQLETIETGGKTIGILAASRVIPEVSWNVENQVPGVLCTYDSTLLVNAIKESENKCDYTIVYVHWGIERNNTPEDYQRQLAMEYIDAGADIVIGSHPHVLQGIEYYNGKPIVYSLGNYIFGSSIEETVALKVTLDNNLESQLEVLPCSAVNAYTEKLEEQKAQETFSYLEDISYNVSINEEGIIEKNN